MLRTKIKRELTAAHATAVAIEEAHNLIEDKRKKKQPLEDKIIDFIKEQLKKVDPLEAMAIAGVAFFIKTGINWSEMIAASEEAQNIFNILIYFQPIFGGTMGEYIRTHRPDNEKLKELFNSPTAEIVEWLLAFTLAFLIVRHFDSIVAGAKDLLGMGKMLLAVA